MAQLARGFFSSSFPRFASSSSSSSSPSSSSSVLPEHLTHAHRGLGVSVRRKRASNSIDMSFEPATLSAEEAVKLVKNGDRVYVHEAAAVPLTLLEALANRHSELKKVELCHLHIEGPEIYTKPELTNFRGNNFFVGHNARQAVNEGRADFTPIFLSEVPLLFRRGILPLDVALIQVSPPNKHGYCSMGVSVAAARSAVENAKIVIAQVNKFMPFTYGDGILHVSDFDVLVESNKPLPQRPVSDISPEEQKIGEYIASLVPNGATLQLGIGSVPDATLKQLKNHKDLGIHTEMFSDGVVDLMRSGVITGMKKEVIPGKLVSSFAVGSQRLYDFMDENPSISMLDCAFVNNPVVIARNPAAVAINSCIEIDLTGQVVSDSIGSKIYSGIGGQMDFIRGSSLSEGGLPIIALPSTTSKGISRIAPFIKEGAGVVTTRAHVHYVVTEYGVVDLFGKNIRERAQALISIAHPNHRESLSAAAHKRFGSLVV